MAVPVGKACQVVLLLALVGCSPAPERAVAAAPLPYGSTSASSPPAPKLPPPRYALASCPLRYEVKAVDTSNMEGGGPDGVELDTFMTVEMRPAAGYAELVAQVSSQPKTSGRRSYDVPNTGYAPVHLHTDGARWTERDGPTQAYDALGSVDGLVWFFPDLPPSGDPGAQADWTITAPDSGEVLAVEAARGSQPGMKEAAARQPPAPPASPKKAQHLDVRLVRWVDVAGTKVAELSMTGTQDAEESSSAGGMGGMRVVAKATITGSYAVTSAGRVLRARTEKNADIHLTTSMGGKDMVQHHTQHSVHQMNLVAACDGPTEASLARPLDREERAIRAWGDAWLASAKGDRDRTLAAFDPALRKKIGDAKLWDTLVAYRKLRGDQALPPPMLLEDGAVAPDGAGLRLTTRGLVLEPAKHMNHPITVAITLHEDNGVWLVDAVRADLVLDPKANLLEISRQRAVVPRGWPPP